MYFRRGGADFWITPKGYLFKIDGDFLPYVSLPKDPAFTLEQLKAVARAQTYYYSCADGEHTVTLGPQDTIEWEPEPLVAAGFTWSTREEKIEFRLVHQGVVHPGGAHGSAWRVTVDAIDGSYLTQVPLFICD